MIQMGTLPCLNLQQVRPVALWCWSYVSRSTHVPSEYPGHCSSESGPGSQEASHCGIKIVPSASTSEPGDSGIEPHVACSARSLRYRTYYIIISTPFQLPSSSLAAICPAPKGSITIIAVFSITIHSSPQWFLSATNSAECRL
jgi:hypothetical protein